ncbi:unnamed protein product, partial [Didymodactylos carnosus]
PSRPTVANRLKQLYTSKQDQLKDELFHIDFISLTTDMWRSSRRRSFVVITAHYTDQQYRAKSIILSFKEFRRRHFSRRICPFDTNHRTI